MMTASATSARASLRRWIAISAVLVLAGGWIAILSVNGWEVDAPVVFLWLGWTAILATAWFLWAAASAATDADAGEVAVPPVGTRDELEREKRSLLKAIKEIDFDHQMGKMSDADAAQLTRTYRARAVEVIKALEARERSEATLSLDAKIERELKARMAVAGVRARGDSTRAEEAAPAAEGHAVVAEDASRPEATHQTEAPADDPASANHEQPAGPTSESAEKSA